jgi:hypothetical protein
MQPTITHYEFHVGPLPVPKSLGRRIKAAGGKFSECRGSQFKRFVTIPATAPDVANEVVRRLSGCLPAITVVARYEGQNPAGLPAWVQVQKVPSNSPNPVACFH